MIIKGIKGLNRAFWAWHSLVHSPCIGTGLTKDKHYFYMCLSEIYAMPNTKVTVDIESLVDSNDEFNVLAYYTKGHVVDTPRPKGTRILGLRTASTN